MLTGATEDDEYEMSIRAPPTKTRGRRVMLEKDIDKKVQLYIKKTKKTRESGGAVSV